ncbi:hypothetical protein ACFSQT_01615 [Mesorhizobium calcicola]|uniref:Uncharacterized protein n=1 Tax=Mesorhizobium calcicola TaxID=1300310 RepID=A0ABW4W7B8_9HYPH
MRNLPLRAELLFTPVGRTSTLRSTVPSNVMLFQERSSRQIRIKLAGIAPAVWRRVIVPRIWHLEQLGEMEYEGGSRSFDENEVRLLVCLGGVQPIEQPDVSSARLDNGREGGNIPVGGRGCMRDLPRDIDADVVIEISRLLDDAAHTAAVAIHGLVKHIRDATQTRLSDQAIEELIVEMASTRGLSMIFEKPAA